LNTVRLRSFHATIYPCSEHPVDRDRQKEDLDRQLEDAITVRCYGFCSDDVERQP